MKGPKTVTVRLLLAKWEDDDVPVIVGCVDETIWEHWDDSDEQAWRKECHRAYGVEATDLEWREVRAIFSGKDLAEAFVTPMVLGQVPPDLNQSQRGLA